MRKVVIYDFASNPVVCKVPIDKCIDSIEVLVVSGDEIVTFRFSDKTSIQFDSCKFRIMEFFDGFYSVRGDEIDKWIGFKPSKKRTASYERMDEFKE